MREGVCDRCGKRAWVNEYTRLSAAAGFSQMQPPGEFCADCFADLPQDLPSWRSRAGVASVRDPVPPGWDDTLRAYEEDR